MKPDLKWTTTIECRMNSDTRLVLAKGPESRITDSLEPGAGTVLEITEERRAAGTSLRLVRMLLLDFGSGPPSSRSYTADELPGVLFRSGGPSLQFESMRCTGTVVLEIQDTVRECHGRLDLKFTDPTVDVAGRGQTDVMMGF